MVPDRRAQARATRDSGELGSFSAADPLDQPLLEDLGKMEQAALLEPDSMLGSQAEPSSDEEASNLERRPPLWRWILAILVPVVALAFVVRKVDMHQVGAAIARADILLVIVAGALFTVGCMGASSVRLWLLMGGMPARRPISLIDLTRVYVASSAAHQLLPAPAAEVARTVALLRRYGYKLRGLIGVQVLEKLADTLSLGVALALVWALSTVPGTRTQLAVEIGTLAGAAGLIGTIVWLRARKKLIVPVIVCSLINDGAHALAIGLVLHAVGIHTGPASWIIVMGATRIAGMIPVAPGQLGVTETAVAFTIGLYGVHAEVAVAAALVYRIVRFVPVVGVGLTQWRSLADAA